MGVTVKGGDTLNDGRKILLYDHNAQQELGHPTNYCEDRYVLGFLDNYGNCMGFTDVSAVCDTYDDWTCTVAEYRNGPHGYWTPVKCDVGSTPSNDNSGGGSVGGLQGLIDRIGSFVQAVQDLLSGGITTAIRDAFTALSALPKALEDNQTSLINAIDQNTLYFNRKLNDDLQFMQAVDNDIRVTLTNAIKDDTAQTITALSNLGNSLTTVQKSIDKDIELVVKQETNAIVEEGKHIESGIGEAANTLTKAGHTDANKISASIALVGTGLGGIIGVASTAIETALAGIVTELGGIATEVATTQGFLSTNIIKIIAIVGAALAIPALADFDKVKGFMSGALEWIIRQQLDVSRKIYDDIAREGM